MFWSNSRPSLLRYSLPVPVPWMGRLLPSSPLTSWTVPAMVGRSQQLCFDGRVVILNGWINLHTVITHRIHGATIYGNIYHQYTPHIPSHVSIYTSTMDPSWVRCCGLVSGVNGISQWFFSQLFFTSYSPALGDDPHLFSQFWKLMEIAYLCFPTRFCLYNSTTPGLLVQSLTKKKRLPSGKRLHSYGKSPFLMGKSTIDGHFQ